MQTRAKLYPVRRRKPPSPASPAADPMELFAPLLAAESPNLFALTHRVTIDGLPYELPKLLLLGERGGGVPIKVGIFAGLDAGREETVAAVARLLMQFDLTPALARDYAVIAYPIVDGPGIFASAAAPATVRKRWAARPDDDDAHYFRAEFATLGLHGMIQFRSAGAGETLTAITRSALLADEVVRPALRALAPFVPVGDDPVRVQPLSPKARRAKIAAGGLLPDPALQPWPFEVELFAPGGVAPETAARALFLATVQILRRYRVFISHKNDL
jgi:hypothetical protein